MSERKREREIGTSIKVKLEFEGVKHAGHKGKNQCSL